MKLLVDDADVAVIKRIVEYYPVDGVTTNPTILAQSGRPPYEVLREIRSLIGSDRELHVQVTATQAEGMMADARRIQQELGQNTYIKVPAVEEGFKAMRELAAQGVNITATAIYTPLQAYLAAKCGAKYAAPYVNRIDNLGYNGIQVTKDIQAIFARNGYAAEVLAASFKNSQQVLELCQYGVGAATLAGNILLGLVKNAAIDAAVAAFNEDFARLAGPGITMEQA